MSEVNSYDSVANIQIYPNFLTEGSSTKQFYNDDVTILDSVLVKNLVRSDPGQIQKNQAQSQTSVIVPAHTVVGYVTAKPVTQSGDGYEGFETGKLLTATIVKDDSGNFYMLTADNKYYQMNTHPGQVGPTSNAQAIKMGENYIKYGYVTAPRAIVDGAKLESGLGISATKVTAEGSAIVSGTLTKEGSFYYLTHGGAKLPLSEKKDLEKAISEAQQLLGGSAEGNRGSNVVISRGGQSL